jgi:uncharacterized membrane protein HdeD (DUF308 family)
MSNVPNLGPSAVEAAIAPEQLARFRGVFFLIGLLLLLLGLVGVAYPFLVTGILVEVFGALLLVGGLAQAGLSVWTRHGGSFVVDLLAGLLGAVIGLFLILRPGVGAEALTLMLAAYFLIGGAFRLVAAFVAGAPARLWVAVVGIIDLVLGVMIFNRWPGDSVWVIGLFVSINLIFSGTLWMTLALSVPASSTPPPPAGSP